MAWYTGDVFYDTALLAGFAYVLIIGNYSAPSKGVLL